MSQDTFRPFSDYLEKEQALSVLQQAVAGADDGEIFLERRRSEGLVLDDGRIKNASYNASVCAPFMVTSPDTVIQLKSVKPH